MSLEEEVRQLIGYHLSAHPGMQESFKESGKAELREVDDVEDFVLLMVGALQDAVFRLAEEIDSMGDAS